MRGKLLQCTPERLWLQHTCGHDLDTLRCLLAHQGTLLRLGCLLLLLVAGRSRRRSGSRAARQPCSTYCCRLRSAMLLGPCHG
jgi:hypothetical protein